MNKFSTSSRGRGLVLLGTSILLLTLCAIYPGKGHAVPGALDLSFGNSGLIGNGFNENNRTNAIALQPDGKILIAGHGNQNSDPLDFYMLRYDSEGELDSSFTSGVLGGVVITDVSGSGSSDSIAAIVVLDGGKILVFGGTNADGTPDFVLARYNEGGDLDTTFNPSGDIPGMVLTDISDSGSQDIAGSMVLQPDGKIVAVGTTNVNGNDDWVVVRYDAEGVLDPTFNPSGPKQGVVVTPITGNSDFAQAVAIQDDGKIVVAGSSGLPSDLTVGRYNTNGGLDSTFNPSGSPAGITSEDFSESGDFDQATDVKIQPDGKVVAGGHIGSRTFLLVRYGSGGLLDPTFNASGSIPGSVTTDFPDNSFDQIQAIALQPDGKIVAAGTGGRDFDTHSDFGLARYNTDGSLDVTTFNPFVSPPGLVQTDFFGDGEDQNGNAMVLQPDGKILVAGHGFFDIHQIFTLARYLGDDADLKITKTASASSVAVGDAVTYTITVTNNGPPSAGGVVIKDTLTGAVNFGGISISQGSCSGTQDLTCNVGNLDSGASVTLTVPVTTTAVGVLSNIASVKSNGNDFDPTNDFAAAFVNVSEAVAPPVPAPSANLSITKTATPPSPKVGDSVVYTLTVINHGPDSAEGVVVTDAVFGAFTDLSATPSQGSCAVSGPVTCNLGSLTNGAGATVTVKLKVGDFGSLSSLATVVSQLNDPDLSDNSATANFSVTSTVGGGGNGCVLGHGRNLGDAWTLLLLLPILAAGGRRGLKKTLEF